jgi:phenolic acid decarboxylase
MARNRSSFLWTCSEFWVKNHERIVYAIHGGPMNGRRTRRNFLRARRLHRGRVRNTAVRTYYFHLSRNKLQTGCAGD